MDFEMMNISWLYVPAGAMAIAVLPMPGGYYSALRILVCGFALWLLWINRSSQSASEAKPHGDSQPQPSLLLGRLEVGGLLALAVLFNPILPIYLGERLLWAPINILGAALFFWLARGGRDYAATKSRG